MTAKSHQTGLIILTALMIGVTAFVFASAATTIFTNHMPFGIERMDGPVYPIEMAVALLVLGAVMTAADVACIRLVYHPDETARNLCNNLCFASWMVALGVFIYGLTTQTETVMYFLLLTLPPMLLWFHTSPSTAVEGDAW